MTLADVAVFSVNRMHVAETETALRSAGEEGYELFVLWSGKVLGGAFNVHHVHVPQQKSFQTERGLLVHVDGEALHKLNVWLFEHQEMLGVQVHAHPTDAFHSETDSSYPIVTTLGGLSVVAADFASHGLFHRSSAGYRLFRSGWEPIRRIHKSSLIQVVE